MAARKLVVFKHKDALGNMPSHKLFDRVMIERINGEPGTPTGGFDDYRVTVNSDGLAESGVTVQVAPITGAWIEAVALLVRSCL